MNLSILWYLSYFVWIAAEIYIGVATRTRNSSGTVRDRGTLRLLWVVIGLSLSVGTTVGQIRGSNLPDGARWLEGCSLGLLVCGMVLRWAAVITLGRAFSSNVAIHATQTVMKSGLYRWMRHPSYTGLLLSILAVGLHTRNWIALLVVILPTTTALLYRIFVEETALREHFGLEYEEYSRATKRLIPGVY